MGQWEPIRTVIYNPTIHRCTCCGKRLVSRTWKAEVQGKAFTFCDESCEQLFHEYWLPRYAEKLGLQRPSV